MLMKFLTEPALLIGKTLIVTDLHIGIEHEILQSGITVPSQLEKIQKRIDVLIKQTKANHLVILGDLKHQVPSISWQEYKEIPIFLEHFKTKVSVVMGNHDGDIQRLAPKDVDIYEPSGFKLGDFLLVHGHAWPEKKDLTAKYLVMGHVHPAVEFFTGSFRSSEPCWLKCDVDNEKLEEKFHVKTNFIQGIVMPSFNHLIGGMAFNSKDFEPLGPLLKNEVLEWKEAEVYLLDGTLLGELDSLKR
jgi:putative SbcD/Mre11-related phosphoesterase